MEELLKTVLYILIYIGYSYSSRKSFLLKEESKMDDNEIKKFAETFKSFGVYMTNPSMATFKNKNDAVEFADCVDWNVSYNYSMGGYNCIQRF